MLGCSLVNTLSTPNSRTVRGDNVVVYLSCGTQCASPVSVVLNGGAKLRLAATFDGQKPGNALVIDAALPSTLTVSGGAQLSLIGELNGPNTELNVNAASFDLNRATLRQLVMSGNAQGQIRCDR
jgi:hypothetical protein